MNTPPCPQDCPQYQKAGSMVAYGVMSIRSLADYVTCAMRLAYWSDDGVMRPKEPGCWKPKKEGTD